MLARDRERRAALVADPVELDLQLRRRRAAFGLHERDDRVARALAQAPAVEVDAAHAGLRGERHELSVQRRHVVLADAVGLGEHDDRAALGRLVGERGELRDLGELGLGHARHRHELGGEAVADRDRAGLVEQQHVDIAGRLDRTAGQGEHVATHEPVHAGDPDRREQRPDRRRDQRDEQRDQRRLGDFGAREQAEGAERRDDDHEDQGERREQDVERDLVRRLAPLGPLDERDHPLEERLAGLLRDFDDDLVGGHARAAGDGAAVAAGLADHGRGLAGDRGLVDGGDALDHGAVAGDQLARGHDHDVAARELGGGLRGAVAEHSDRLLAHVAQRVGLGAAASLGERLGHVREHDRQPQPDRDRERVPGGLVAAAERLAAERLDHPGDRGDDGAELDDEHHRVAELDARVELLEAVDQSAR